jgi:N-glycosylase/DNA lyase
MSKRPIKQSTKKKEYLQELLKIYNKIKTKIEDRLEEFSEIWAKGTEYDIYCELIFCLFTPQSKAKICNEAVFMLQDKDLILDGTEEQLGKELNTVRFRYTKAKNVVDSRKIFFKNGNISIKPIIRRFKDPKNARSWLVENVRGMGYKEASHFLRNIGMGEELAILDRHILKNLVLLGVLEDVPKSITGKKYLEIEEKMRKFSIQVDIPLNHLDLLLWYKETGEIFK